MEEMWLTKIFPEWQIHRLEALALIYDFESLMSPRKLLDRPPLSGIVPESGDWLGSLLHEYWVWKVPVRRLTLNAEMAVRQTDSAYSLLQEELKLLPADAPLPVHAERLNLWVDFHAQCQSLTDSLARFPIEVRLP
jgi:hypothetical protein